MEGDKSAKISGVVGKTVSKNSGTYDNECKRWYKAERSRIVQEYLDSLILLFEHLQAVYDEVDEEENEYKTRYENQVELNAHYEDSIAEMKEQKENFRRRNQMYNSMDNSELKKLNVDLKRQKMTLESQLKDLEWRLDQEAKAYYKADEKRKALQKDAVRNHYKLLDEELGQLDKNREKRLKALEHGPQLNDYKPKTLRDSPRAKRVVDESPLQERMSTKSGRSNSSGPEDSSVTDSTPRETPNQDSPKVNRKAALKEANRRSKEGTFNVPDEKPVNISMNKRVLDPRHGPINKAAAVRQLPKIDTPDKP